MSALLRQTGTAGPLPQDTGWEHARSRVEQATLKESKLNITYGCLAEVGQGPGATRSLGLCAALAVFAAVALLSGCSAAHPAESAKPVVGTSATPSAKTT